MEFDNRPRPGKEFIRKVTDAARDRQPLFKVSGERHPQLAKAIRWLQRGIQPPKRK